MEESEGDDLISDDFKVGGEFWHLGNSETVSSALITKTLQRHAFIGKATLSFVCAKECLYSSEY